MKKFGFIVFIIALFIGIASAFNTSFGSCQFNFDFNNKIVGSGISKTEQRNVSNFTKIEVSGALNVEVVTNKDFNVTVEADDNLLSQIKTELDGDTLKVYSKGWLSTKTKINIKISMPNLDGIEVSGASNVTASNLENEDLEIELSGASKLKIDGKTTNAKFDVSGASKFDGENLEIENAEIDNSGASSVLVSVTKNLTADTSGASKVTYIGNPAVEKSVSGASSIVKR
jgi:Putative auto-transporter adhesin, head GIN domain